MLHRALGASRYVVIVAVFSTLLSSMALLVYGALMEVVALLQVVRDGIISSAGGKALALRFIEATDIFLIGIVLFIFSLGLYTLFIDDKLALPAWLEVKDLDDLKAQLISVVIAALAVIFLGYVVQWEGDPQILGLGAAVALMVAALAFFLNTKPREQ
ncbi:MAG: YqhA family protein [Deltaproteobacteria bacterium]|nr:YqhA family protein [Deltaproteobacteria bacterium]